MKRKTKSQVRKPQSDKKTGLPPGKMVYIGEEKTATVRINVIDFDENHVEEKTFFEPEQCFAYKNTLTNTWINVDGIYQTGIIEKIGKHYGFSTLALEDVVNTNSRPKIDDFKEYLFMIVKMMNYDTQQKHLNVEQVSIFLGKNYVISFQENEGDLFGKIRERLRDPQSRLRQYGCDFLTYSLLDRIIDEYFVIIESMGEELEDLEEEVATRLSKEFLIRYNSLKRESITLRKAVWPSREVVNYMLRSDTQLIKTAVLPYFRDLYDHTIQVIETIETYRDLFSDIMDLYLSSLSLKMNEVMKVLTVISTIFIPLTFIVGVYGMNFDFMPELHWQYGYYVVIGLMLCVAIGMMIFFKRKHWF